MTDSGGAAPRTPGLRHWLGPIVVGAALAVAAAAAIRLAGTATDDERGPSLPSIGDAAPGFRLARLAGGEESLEALAGTPVFLNFWATWCPPCVEELPSIQALDERYADSELAVLAMSVDTIEPREIRSFLADRGIDLRVVLDPGGEVSRRYGTFRFPETYLIDREGRIAVKYVGPQVWTRSEFLADIDALVAN